MLPELVIRGHLKGDETLELGCIGTYPNYHSPNPSNIFSTPVPSLQIWNVTCKHVSGITIKQRALVTLVAPGDETLRPCHGCELLCSFNRGGLDESAWRIPQVFFSFCPMASYSEIKSGPSSEGLNAAFKFKRLPSETTWDFLQNPDAYIPCIVVEYLQDLPRYC